MPGHNHKSAPGEYPNISLERHFDVKIRDLKEQFYAVLDEREKAHQLQAQALEKQVDLTRDAYDLAHNLVVKDIGDLKRTRDTMEGKASQTSVNIGYFISAILLLMEILRWFSTVSK